MRKNRPRTRKSAIVPKSRWLAYATAGASSAFACANSAEAAIHYSGRIGEFFNSTCDRRVTRAQFQLDQPGDYIRLVHKPGISCASGYGGDGHFGVFGLANA